MCRSVQSAKLAHPKILFPMNWSLFLLHLWSFRRVALCWEFERFGFAIELAHMAIGIDEAPVCFWDLGVVLHHRSGEVVRSAALHTNYLGSAEVNVSWTPLLDRTISFTVAVRRTLLIASISVSSDLDVACGQPYIVHDWHTAYPRPKQPIYVQPVVLRPVKS